MRLFIAIELDDRARAVLAEWQHRLGELDRVVRWVRPEQIHLTLKFLGEVADRDAAVLAGAMDDLAGQPAFSFEVGGLGLFGSPRSPRVIWAGVRMPNEPLLAMQAACEKAMNRLGYPPEGRAFSPHLTLGRVKDLRAGRDVWSAVERVKAEPVPPLEQRAESVVLFESILWPAGPQYGQVHRVALAGLSSGR